MDQGIFEKVRETLTGALGVEADEVKAEASLTKDLGAESIDFIDIIFRLEKAFDIKIPSGDLFPANLFTDEKFAKDGLVTSEGIEMLKEKYPYMHLDDFSKDPQVSKLADQFTVQMIVEYLQEKTGNKAEA